MSRWLRLPAGHPQDVVERISVAVGIEHRRQSTAAGPGACVASEHPAKYAAEAATQPAIGAAGPERRFAVAQVQPPQAPEALVVAWRQALPGGFDGGFERGILRWEIDGCLDWQRNGLRPPTAQTSLRWLGPTLAPRA